MQNIDFRAQLHKHPALYSSTASASSHDPSLPKHRSRMPSFLFAGIIIFFTIGLFAGIKIGKIQKIESTDCIVRYPEGQRNTTGASSQSRSSITRNKQQGTEDKNGSLSFANPAESSVSYIIKVGEFPSASAKKLSQRLNHLPELRKLRPQKCKDVEESEGRGTAFRMKTEPNAQKENVLVGCFANAARASHILNIIKKSGLPGSSRAVLYEY